VSATNDEITDAIADNLARPKRVRTDAGEAEQHSLQDQLEAAKFVRETRETAVSPFRCLSHARTTLPGGCG